MTPNETKDSAVSDLSIRPGWIGVDLDGTLAHTTDNWDGHSIGEPIPATVAGVKSLIAKGVDVRIVTARACSTHVNVDGVPCLDRVQVNLVGDWCEKHLGKRLPVQFWKDYQMIQLWDDRAIQFAENSGEPLMHAFNLLQNLCTNLYDHVLRGGVPAGLMEAVRQACGIPAPEPEPLIVQASALPPNLKKRPK
jgi:hypothetical protein